MTKKNIVQMGVLLLTLVMVVGAALNLGMTRERRVAVLEVATRDANRTALHNRLVVLGERDRRVGTRDMRTLERGAVRVGTEELSGAYLNLLDV